MKWASTSALMCICATICVAKASPASQEDTVILSVDSDGRVGSEEQEAQEQFSQGAAKMMRSEIQAGEEQGQSELEASLRPRPPVGVLRAIADHILDDGQETSVEGPPLRRASPPRAGQASASTDLFGAHQRHCEAPSWANGQPLCQEVGSHKHAKLVHVTLDQLGASTTMIHDGGTCTTQCSKEMWWQQPVMPNITCRRGYWTDASGRDVNEMKCRTAPRVWALSSAALVVISVFIWAFMYHAPVKANQASLQPPLLRPHDVLRPQAASNVFVIRD